MTLGKQTNAHKINENNCIDWLYSKPNNEIINMTSKLKSAVGKPKDWTGFTQQVHCDQTVG